MKNSFGRINTKLSYSCNPPVALNCIPLTSNQKQWIAYSFILLNSSLLKQMNFVMIVNTNRVYFSSSSCYELIHCSPWDNMILYQIISMCILNSNMSWVFFFPTILFSPCSRFSAHWIFSKYRCSICLPAYDIYSAM